MRVKKSEWHQVEKQYEAEIDIGFLSNVYTDATDEELEEILAKLESGDMTIEQLIEDAEDAWYDIEWDYVDEDWWTERKGGYDETYEILE